MKWEPTKYAIRKAYTVYSIDLNINNKDSFVQFYRTNWYV